MKNGIERIAAERQRQIEVEGWTPEHDADHTDQSLAMAAACYAAPKPIYTVTQDGGPEVGVYTMVAKDPWPWMDEWPRGCPSKAWDKRKQHSRIRQLEIAGALIAAEIDRLLDEEQQFDSMAEWQKNNHS